MLLPRAAWLVCAFAFGCAGAPSDSARVRRAVEAHAEDFARYDRWARRLGLADSAFRSEEALAEAAFAPIRRDRDIAAVWLVREGPDARALRHPEDAPDLPGGGWVTVVTEPLGPLEAQQTSLTVGGEARDAILVRRSRPTQGDATLHVTIAFARPPRATP